MRSMYFKQPSNWSKIRRISLNETKDGISEKDSNLNSQILFHMKALSAVKTTLKSNCSFLAHSVENGKVGFIAICNIKGKSKKFIIDTAGKTAAELVADDYKDLKKVLDERIRS